MATKVPKVPRQPAVASAVTLSQSVAALQNSPQLFSAFDKLQGLLSAMTDLVMVVDQAGRYLEIIPTNPNLLYLPREMLLQKTIHETLPIEKATELHNHVLRALETGDTVHTEYSLQIEDNLVWFEAAISPMTEISVMWVARDVSARKQAEELTREQVLQMDLVLRSSLYLTANVELPLLLNTLLQNALRIAPEAADAHLFLYDAEKDQLRLGGAAPLGGEVPFTPRPKGLTYTVARRGVMMAVSDMSTHPLFVDLGDKRRNAVLGMPLKIEQKVLGVMNVSYKQVHDFSASELRALRLLGDQAAVALHNTQLYRSLEQNAAELSALYQASTELLNSRSDLRNLAQRVVNIVTEKFQFAHCGLLLLMESTRELRLLAHAGDSRMEPSAPLSIDGQGLIATAVRSGEVVYAPDVSADDRYLLGNVETQSELVVPLKVGVHILGALNVESAEREAFDDRLRRLIGAFAEQVALAMENAILLSRLELARETAEEANHIKSQFLANTSHELRTPLTGIIGSLSMVMDELCASHEEERECVQIAFTASQRLLSMINNVLDVAKIEAGHMDVHMQEFAIEPIMNDVYALMRLPADEKRISLEVKLPPAALPKIWADPDMVRQVLLNLVGNAVKFTHKGKVRLAVTLQDQKAVITVMDTGIGIDLADQPRLFQPFVQVDGSMTRRYGGTGLGLSISRRLAELMGGELTLFSEGEGKGATFTLTLLVSHPLQNIPT